MTETSNQMLLSEQPLKLEQAHIDLTSVRSQMVIGACLTVASCTISDSSTLFSMSFGLHVVVAFLAGLVSLEISGLYGNRLGAIPAVWSSLLLSAYPASIATVFKLNQPTLCTLFFLFSFFAYQRFRLLKEKAYLIAAVVWFLLSVANGISALILPPLFTLYEVLFRKSPARILRSMAISQKPYNASMVSISLLLFGTVWLGLAMIFQITVPVEQGTISTLSNNSLPVAAFCIILPLLALPVSAAGNKRQNRVIVIIGLILLTLVACSFHNLRGAAGLF